MQRGAGFRYGKLVWATRQFRGHHM